MTNPRFGGLARLGSGTGLMREAADKADPMIDPEDEDEPCDEVDGKEKERKMTTPNTESADYQAGLTAGEETGRKAGIEAERARFSAVMASEHFAGREALATELLASDLPADKIVASLAKSPSLSATMNDNDDADRQLMRERLQGSNPDLGNDEGNQDAAAQAKADNFGWGKAHAKVAKRYGRAK